MLHLTTTQSSPWELLPCGLEFVLISCAGHFCGCSLNSLLKHLHNLSAVTRSDDFKLHENLNVKMTRDPSVGWEQLSLSVQIFHMANKTGKILAKTTYMHEAKNFTVAVRSVYTLVSLLTHFKELLKSLLDLTMLDWLYTACQFWNLFRKWKFLQWNSRNVD